MSAKPKLSLVKKVDSESEFEMLLRRTSEYQKLQGPQVIKKIKSTRRLPFTAA
jgi:hypothetical protein